MKILVSFSSQKSHLLSVLKEAWEGNFSIAFFNPALVVHDKFYRTWNPNQENSPYWFLDWEASPLNHLSCHEVVVFCTSGTTGRIKEVVLKKEACRFNIETIHKHLGLDESYTILGLPPLFHAFGLNLGFLQAIEKNIPYKAFDKFTSKAVFDVLKESKKVLLPLVPRMIESFDFTPLPDVEGCTITGGDFVQEAHIGKLKKLFPKMNHTIGYGMTEAGPAITHSSFLELSYDGFIGSPLPNIETEIRDNLLWFLSPGQASWVREADGIWERTEGKFLSTGDIITEGKEGLFFRARQKDILKRKAETLFPREIEILIKKELPFELNIQLKMKEDKLILYAEDIISIENMDFLKKTISMLPSIYRPDKIEATKFNLNALGKIAA